MNIKISKLRQIIREEVSQLKLPFKRTRDPRRVVHFDYSIKEPLENQEFRRQLARELSGDLGINIEAARKIVDKKSIVVPDWKAIDGVKFAIQRVADLNDVDVRMRVKFPSSK